MQISTRDEDFLVDTLELRSEMYVLNECFTDPNIVKVIVKQKFRETWLIIHTYIGLSQAFVTLKYNSMFIKCLWFLSGFPWGRLRHRVATKRLWPLCC